jgi:hypothetical protein
MQRTDDENRYQRTLKDRRGTPTPIISKYTVYGGRRKTIRRACDKKTHIFVDLYSTRLLAAVLLLLALSCMDAWLTLALLERGTVVEANPLMAYFLNYGILPFAIFKFVITAIALLVLCVLKNVRITRISLPIAIKIYLAVIIYEIYLYMM